MRVLYIAFACGMLLLMEGFALARLFQPERATHEQGEVVLRVHRAMRRRPVLCFVLPVVLAVLTFVDQLVGVLSGDRPPTEVLFPLVDAGIVIAIVRIWRWPDGELPTRH